MVFTLVDAVYDKGFDAGVESITKWQGEIKCQKLIL